MKAFLGCALAAVALAGGKRPSKAYCQTDNSETTGEWIDLFILSKGVAPKAKRPPNVLFGELSGLPADETLDFCLMDSCGGSNTGDIAFSVTTDADGNAMVMENVDDVTSSSVSAASEVIEIFDSNGDSVICCTFSDTKIPMPE